MVLSLTISRVISALRSQSAHSAEATSSGGNEFSSTSSSSGAARYLPPFHPSGFNRVSHAYAKELYRCEQSIDLAVHFFFERMYDLNPTLDRDATITRLAMKEHLYDQSFGALILAITCVVRLLPDAISVNQAISSAGTEWSSAVVMLGDAMRLISNPDLGTHPDLDSAATSMMIGSVLMAQGAAGPAYLKYKEAVGLAEILKLDKPSTFDALGSNRERERALRLTSILSSAGRSVVPRDRLIVTLSDSAGCARWHKADIST